MKDRQQGGLILQMLKRQLDPDAYLQMHIDLTDLVGASKWLVDTMEIVRQNDLTQDELEDLLINIDIAFIQHVTFHLKTFRKDIKRYLASCPE